MEMRELLHEDEELSVALIVADGQLLVELESRGPGLDLSEPHEVVVGVDGEGCELDVEDQHRATALVTSSVSEDPEPMMLMVRVYEFFEGWELFADT